MIVNNAGKVDTLLAEMEQWLILHNIINYIQYEKHPKNFHSLSVRAVNKEKNRESSTEGKR